MNEAAFYILDGEGYEIHDGIRYDWKAGDVAIVHNNCVHQHFNASPTKPARALVMKTKPMFMDVVHVGSPEMEALAREQVLLPITSPVQQDLQPGSVPPHRQWAATLLSVWVQAYNTKLIKKDSLPRTYRDLLDPKWKGKLGVEGKDEDWFASVVDVTGGGETGLKFFRDLVVTNGLSVRQGHTLLNNLVISGEVPLALNIYNYMPEQAKKKGAPIDWFAIEPAIARSNGVGVARRAPHPNAAMLFYEYLLGDAQQYFVSMAERSAPTVIVFVTNKASEIVPTRGRGNFSPSARDRPCPVTMPMRAQAIWMAAMSGQVRSAVQRIAVPNCAPTTE